MLTDAEVEQFAQATNRLGEALLEVAARMRVSTAALGMTIQQADRQLRERRLKAELLRAGVRLVPC